MAKQYFPGSNTCATCMHWTGARDVDMYGAWVKVDSATTKGKCTCKSSWNGVAREAGYMCGSYKKFPALR